MDKLTFEHLRLIAVSAFSSLAAIVTPTSGFVLALVVMFAFNIFAGMRADGVSIIRCKNFKMSKFVNSLAELLLYLLIIETMQVILTACGDGGAASVVVKSLTYVFLYVYTCNAFRNLITAYPKRAALRIVYHLIRLEFTRMLPDHWRPIIDRAKAETEAEPDTNTQNLTPNT